MSVNMPYNVWCWDDGYGDNKCATENKLFMIPTNYTNWKPRHKDDFADKRDGLLDYLGVEFNGSKHLVGQGAMKQSSSSWFGGENKHEDPSFKILMNACLGLMANNPHEEVDVLVMGLPVDSDSDDARHKLLEGLVVGNHQMRITLGDGSEFSREVNIKNLIVKKQPFGSLCDVMLDDQGEIVEKDIAKGFNIVIDIGSRTLNVYTLDHLEPISDLCFHTNDGMYTSYLMVNDYIQQKLKYSVPTGKLPLIVKDKAVKDIDLTPVINKSYEILSYEIKKVIDTKFINHWALANRILITGGGSEVLKPYLCQLFKSKEVIFLDRYANVRGLRKYGIRQASKIMPKKTQETVSARIGSHVYN